MSAIAPALLDAAALACRLTELAGDERAAQVEFLLHLGELDRREAWLAAGYGSLWDYCRKVLHLREGAAWRRIAAMRALRRLPRLAAALADGRLCLTTVAILDPVLTEANADELLVTAAYGSKAEVEALVVALQPNPAPADGVRRLPERREAPAAVQAPPPAVEAEPRPLLMAPPPAPALAARPTIQPVAPGTSSLRVTIDAALKRDLDRLAELLSHVVPSGDLAAVLREAVACAVEKHGKRRGAVAPARQVTKAPKSKPASAPAGAAQTATRREHVPAELRRQVWARDGGCCAWTGPEGHRRGSRWRPEVDHVVAAALGGRTDLANLRLIGRSHNRLHAERTFGRAFMDRFRGASPRAAERTSPGRGGSAASAPA